MQGLNYTRLNSISNSVSPYRGSLNRFPIGNRKQNNKYFLVGEENGSRIFNIVYGQNWNSVDITKDEYDELNKQGSSKIRAYKNGDENGYCRYDVTPNIVGVVRPDNTFEFTAKRYGQGDRGVLSAFGHGWLLTDSRRGGMVWMGRLNGNGERGVMPIYRGMRVHCETMRPTKPITVVGRKVDRKVGKALLADYADFYAVTETMTKAMDYETFVKTSAEVLTEHMSLASPEAANSYWLHRHHTEYTLVADALIHTAPLDAAILYMVAWDVGSMRWNIRRYLEHNTTRYSAHEDTPHMMFTNLKRKLNKEIYKQNEQVFKKVEYTAPEMYPPSEWGYTVMVDGMEVQQYE